MTPLEALRLVFTTGDDLPLPTELLGCTEEELDEVMQWSIQMFSSMVAKHPNGVPAQDLGFLILAAMCAGGEVVKAAVRDELVNLREDAIAAVRKEQ